MKVNEVHMFSEWYIYIYILETLKYSIIILMKNFRVYQMHLFIS